MTLKDIQKKYGESVYPLYKDEMQEPYMQVIKGNGFLGVVLYDEESDKIQCHICGEWKKQLPYHIAKKHGETTRGYREQFGLLDKTPMVTPMISKVHSDSARMNNSKRTQIKWSGGVMYIGDKKIDMEKRNKRLERARLGLTIGMGNVKVQSRNRIGSCDAQICARLKVVADTAGRNPTVLDCNRVDPPLYGILQRRFGSFNKAKKYYSYAVKEVKTRLDDAKMIGQLRVFIIKKRRLPIQREFKGDILQYPKEAYLREFGSWRRALLMAGADQLLDDSLYKNDKIKYRNLDENPELFK